IARLGPAPRPSPRRGHRRGREAGDRFSASGLRLRFHIAGAAMLRATSSRHRGLRLALLAAAVAVISLRRDSLEQIGDLLAGQGLIFEEALGHRFEILVLL